MKPSERIVTFIKQFEAFRSKAYKPTKNDVWTIGWGSTRGVKEGDTITVAGADARFNQELAEFAADVTKLVRSDTTQNQFDAMLSFAYNVGTDIDADTKAEGLGDSTLLRKHNAGDIIGAAAEFIKWNKQDGVVLRGLTRRRTAEAEIYRNG